MKIMGLVLAGGLSRRMGGQEKSLMDLSGRPLIQVVADRLRPQVDTLVINANGDANRFAFTGLPVVADTLDGFAGPLAGLLAGMRFASDATHILTAAADTPFFPTNLAKELAAPLSGEHDIAMARSGTRVHPVFGLWPMALADALEAFLVKEDKRKILEFAHRYTLHEVSFPIGQVDPFFNVNTPRDLEEARSYQAGEMA